AVDQETYRAHTTKLGIPEFVIGMVVGFMTDIKNGQEEKVSADLENKLGYKPASLKEGLKTLFNL
ncbi:MAG: SDR family NAD(P)-dependent oxidoreductase, partial [Sphingobacteriaceae bacterium]